MYICIIRSWWDGDSIDSVAWCIKQNAACKRIVISKDVHGSEKYETIILDAKKTKKFILNVKGSEILTRENMVTPIILTHYDIWVFYKLETEINGGYLFIRGGKHFDDDLNNLVYDNLPKITYD